MTDTVDQRAYRCLYLILSGMLLIPVLGSQAIGEDTVDRAIEAMQSAGAEGSGFEGAIPAANELRKLSADQIPRLLDGMSDVNPVAENWFRGVVFDVARQSGKVSTQMLADYAMDQTKNPLGRGLAMELIRRQDPGRASSLIGKCLNDPSLPLREMAVDQAIDQAKEFRRADESAAAIKRYRQALAAARHPRQLTRIIEALEKLGDPVSTAEAFVLITDWQSVAPFDNVDGVGFDTIYLPESLFASRAAVDVEAKYEGKSGPIRWRSIQGAQTDGVVDLAAAYDKEKGAVAYLFSKFESSKERPAQVRLGCINANKVWVNGKEVMSNEVYHSGSMLDQYIADCELRKGTNRILLKICQNEQTDSWAQKWEFQFRITDPTGKGLRSGE